MVLNVVGMLEPLIVSLPTVSQRVAMARPLLRRAKLEARKRQRLGKRSPFSAAALSVVAARVGWSGATLSKALAVMDAAKADRRRFGDLVKDMDRSGKVDGAYRCLRARGHENRSDRT